MVQRDKRFACPDDQNGTLPFVPEKSGHKDTNSTGDGDRGKKNQEMVKTFLITHQVVASGDNEPHQFLCEGVDDWADQK